MGPAEFSVEGTIALLSPPPFSGRRGSHCGLPAGVLGAGSGLAAVLVVHTRGLGKPPVVLGTPGDPSYGPCGPRASSPWGISSMTASSGVLVKTFNFCTATTLDDASAMFAMSRSSSVWSPS